MSPAEKRTLGFAIASLVCGCLVIFPLLGILFSLAAIILGIVALVMISKNKETLKGNGLAISGIVLGGIGLVIIPFMTAMFVAIAIPNLLRARLNANDAAAKASLQALVTAIESYAAATGSYPHDIYDLTDATPPYLAEDIILTDPHGYDFECEAMDAKRYTCTAAAQTCNVSGSKKYTVTTGNVWTESECTPSYGSPTY